MKEVEKTPFPELDIVLENHTKKLQDQLGENFVGLYLQGSLAVGDFDLTSDIDFVVVINEDLTEKQAELVEQIHQVTCDQNNRWVKRLEYSFFPKKILARHSSPFMNKKRNDTEERKLWYFDNGSRKIERSDHCNTLVTRWTIREKGITLAGPDPKKLIDVIEPNDLRQEIKDTMIGWGEELLKNPHPYDNRFYQSYLVLNYSRMLHDLHEGTIGSKLQGVFWAKENLKPEWIPLINFCWKERQDSMISVKQSANPEIFEQSLEFVKYAVDQGRKYTIA